MTPSSVTRAMVPRAASAQRVASLAAKWSDHVVAEEDPERALAQALAETQPEDLLLVTGSLYLVGDAKRLLPHLLTTRTAEMLTQVKG